jgi:hypothetical protein
MLVKVIVGGIVYYRDCPPWASKAVRHLPLELRDKFIEWAREQPIKGCVQYPLCGCPRFGKCKYEGKGYAPPSAKPVHD